MMLSYQNQNFCHWAKPQLFKRSCSGVKHPSESGCDADFDNEHLTFSSLDSVRRRDRHKAVNHRSVLCESAGELGSTFGLSMIDRLIENMVLNCVTKVNTSHYL